MTLNQLNTLDQIVIIGIIGGFLGSVFSIAINLIYDLKFKAHSSNYKKDIKNYISNIIFTGIAMGLFTGFLIFTCVSLYPNLVETINPLTELFLAFLMTASTSIILIIQLIFSAIFAQNNSN
ncbi:MAG: hypothetical protein ACRC2S_02485 [Waterburya sp.]